MFFYVLLSIGLAMDAFTLAIITGMSTHKKVFKMACVVGLFFGIFQGVMPLIGFYVGKILHDFIAFNHWISFVILLLIGIKMLWEAIKKEEEKKVEVTLIKILLFSLAGSIDALAVGFSLAFVGAHIVSITLLIGLVTLLFSFLGVYMGVFFQNFFGKKMELLGGIILIIIAFRFL